jgi:hypothetical protein
MTPTPTTTHPEYVTATTVRKPRPIRGILWGLMLGVGAAAIAIIVKLIEFDQVQALLIVAGGVVLGLLWSILGPAKRPKGPPPRRLEPAVEHAAPDVAAPAPPVPPIVAPDVVPDAAVRDAVPDELEVEGEEELRIEPLDVEPLDLPPAPGTRAAPDQVPEPPPTEARPNAPDEPRSEPSPPPPPPPPPPPAP